MATPGGSSTVEELVSDGKSHGPSWLLGRHVKSVKASPSVPTSTYVQELTTQIRQNLVEEMEEKVQKVQHEVDTKVNTVKENFKAILKKLVEENPGIKVDLGDLGATSSGDTENGGTPMTEDGTF